MARFLFDGEKRQEEKRIKEMQDALQRVEKPDFWDQLNNSKAAVADDPDSFVQAIARRANAAGIGPQELLSNYLGQLKNSTYPTPECFEAEVVQEIVASGEPKPEQAVHLQTCEPCRELLSACRLDPIALEQLLVKVQKAGGEVPVARLSGETTEREERPLKSSGGEKRSFWRTVREGFQQAANFPALATASLVVVAAIGFVASEQQVLAPPMVGLSKIAVTIEKSDPHNPEGTNESMRAILEQTLQGKEIDPTQIQEVRSLVDQKKAEVANDPGLAMKWNEIDSQLSVTEWWNRYLAQSKIQGDTVGLIPAHPLQLSASDGKGTAHLSWDPTVQDRLLLNDSLDQTNGLKQVVIITPENKTFTLGLSEKQLHGNTSPGETK